MEPRQVTYSGVAPYILHADRRQRVPALPVVLHYQGRQFGPIQALVDSGADTSLFSVDYAYVLGIDVASCPPIVMIDAFGIQVGTGYTCALTLEVGGRYIPAEVTFSPAFGDALLGRADFFQAFAVGLDQRESVILFEPFL